MKFKSVTVKELRSKKSSEITKHLDDLRKNLAELRHALYTNKEGKTHQLGEIKKAIAQAQTILAEIKREEK